MWAIALASAPTKTRPSNSSTMEVKETDWQHIHLIADPAGPEPYVREWASEAVHTLNDSKHAYRLSVLCKECLQDCLFYGPYAYHALITNMGLPLEEQIA
jgi:hypothetical protein